MFVTVLMIITTKGTKSGEATSQSAHESFDARPGNLTKLST